MCVCVCVCVCVCMFGLIKQIISFLESSNEDIRVFFVWVKLLMKVPYISPSTFDHFADHLQ